MPDNFPYNAEITPEQRAEIEAIFSNEKLMVAMQGLAHAPTLGGQLVDQETIRKRRDAALDAFSKNPPRHWSI